MWPPFARLASSRAPTKTYTPCPRSIGSGYGAVWPADAMSAVPIAAIARASMGYASLGCLDAVARGDGSERARLSDDRAGRVRSRVHAKKRRQTGVRLQ